MGYSGFLKLAAWIVAVPTLLVAALVAYVHFGDLNWLRPHIESAVARHSNFELSLDGEFDLDLFPDPAVLVENASLRGAAAGVGDLAASLGHLSGRVRMKSLLERPIRIVDLTLADLDATRVADDSMAPQEPPEDELDEEAYSGLPVLVESAELSTIKVSNESATGEILVATLDSASIQQEATDQVTLSAQGKLGGTALKSPGVPVGASLNAQFKPGFIDLEDVRLQLGDSTASGDLSISTGDRFSLTGVIRSDRLDLSPLAKPEPAQQGGSATGEESNTSSRYVFGEEKLPFRLLRGADFDLRLANKKLILERFLLLDVETYIKLEQGNLLLTNRFRGDNGGRSSIQLKVDATGKPAAIDADIKARDLRLNLISGDISDKSLIPPLDITVELVATGNSPRELAASSNGSVLVSLREGRIANNMIGLFIGDFMKQLFGKLNPFAEQESFSSLQCTIVGMDITDGDVDFTGMLLQTEKVKAIGDGVIDLGTEALKADFETQPREGLGISASMFVTPFIGVEGTLAKPRMTFRKKSAVVAVATGGLSLLAKGITGRAAGQSSDCRPLMEEIGGHPPLD